MVRTGQTDINLRDSNTIGKMSRLWLNSLVAWLVAVFRYWFSNSRRISAIDTWMCNRNIKRRKWRVPELCKYLHEKYGNLVELHLLGQRILVITDMKIASSLMTKYGNILKQRFGNESGLQNLNMHFNGIIWNNNVPQWKMNRSIFETTLNTGSQNLEALALSHLETLEKTKLEIAKPVTVLELLRNFTLSMTMEGLFGIPMPNTLNVSSWQEEAKTTVANYFKAWEFYLLNPNSNCSSEENKLHLNSCMKMQRFARGIFDKCEEMGGCNFVTSLSQCNTDNGTIQCTAEMLLAGTDTSSLTMFYTMLFLADHPEIGNDISSVIHNETQEMVDQKISNLYYESMRLIPVGPVILRQCEANIEEDEISLKRGDGIIFNIAGMNRTHYEHSEHFDPSRFEHGNVSFPLSFGTGKKACVGKMFAEKEMKLFFTWFLTKYTVLGHRERMIELLKTRWDVANAPESDIKLTIFPRNRVFFVGRSTDKGNMLDAMKAAYPKMKIIKAKQTLRNDRKDFESELKTHLELLETIKSEFVLIEGSILDCFINMKANGLTHGYDEKYELRSMRNSLMVYFPSSERGYPGKQRIDEEYLQMMKQAGCRYHFLSSPTESGRFMEIMNFVGNRSEF